MTFTELNKGEAVKSRFVNDIPGHTKGDWYYVEYIPEGISINGIEYLITTDKENPQNDIALALHEEDARLIAVAPEMLATLEVIMSEGWIVGDAELVESV